jgi:hypothetical protein
MVQKNTIRKEIALMLTEFSYNDIVSECKVVLTDLRQYPKENKYQIKYYERFWLLLSEF